jgi:hypothetical protein
MSDEIHWLGLLGPVPPKDGECKRRVMHDAPFEDWVEVRLVLGGGVAGQRIVTAMFDADDQPGSVSDLVTTGGGKREAVSGRIGTGGRFQGTYRVSDNDQNIPRPLTDAEEQALRAIAVALRQRYP